MTFENIPRNPDTGLTYWLFLSDDPSLAHGHNTYNDALVCLCEIAKAEAEIALMRNVELTIAGIDSLTNAGGIVPMPAGAYAAIVEYSPN